MCVCIRPGCKKGWVMGALEKCGSRSGSAVLQTSGMQSRDSSSAWARCKGGAPDIAINIHTCAHTRTHTCTHMHMYTHRLTHTSGCTVMSQYLFLHTGLAFVTQNAAKIMSWILRPGHKKPYSFCLDILGHSLLELNPYTVSKPQPTDDTNFPSVRLVLQVEPLASAELTQLMSKAQLCPQSSTHIAY